PEAYPTDYTVLLRKFGEQANIHIETYGNDSPRYGELALSCSGLERCLTLDPEASLQLERKRAEGKLALASETNHRRLEYALVDPLTEIYYFVDFSSLNAQDITGVE